MKSSTKIVSFALFCLLHACGASEPTDSTQAALTVGTQNVRVESVTDVSVTIRWSTTSPTTSMVAYMSTLADLTYKQDKTKVTSHQLQLTGLKKNTAYTFQIRSCLTVDDTFANDWSDCEMLDVMSFNTLAGPPPSLGLLSDMTVYPTLYAPANNWWNLDVTGAPTDPNSAAIVQTIKGYDTTYGGRLHPDFTPSYGIPYAVVGVSTPLSTVSFGNTAESDNGAPGGPLGYPIPVEAKTNPRYIENSGGLDGDRHMLLLDRDRRMAFELSYVSFANGQWSAGYGAVFPLDSNYRRPEGWSSTDAAGLSVLAGLVRADEVYGANPIRHALRCSIRHTNKYVWPASHTGSTDVGAPPLGTRLRLKASKDISGFAPELRKIFQAMKTYGLIVADRGGNMYVQGTMDAKWDNGVLNPAFHALHVEDFDIIKLGYSP